jgi:hypothetical protein
MIFLFFKTLNEGGAKDVSSWYTKEMNAMCSTEHHTD